MKARSLAALSMAALGVLAPRLAAASEADVFENKVKPVSGQVYRKAGKLELTIPSAQLSFGDAFFSKYMAGAKVGYHFTEYLSASLTGSAGVTSTTGSTVLCSDVQGLQGCHEASEQELYQVPGLIRWMAGAEIGFSPLYGKLNVFGEKAVHFDVSILGGADLVSYRDVLTGAQVAAGATPGNATAVGGHLGVGARIFLSRSVALRLELRDVVYSVSHLATGKLQNQLFGDIGLSFFIPLAQRAQ